MSDEGWIPLRLERPKNGERVEWLDPNTGQVNKGSIAGRLWVFDDSGMYCYYEPTFWRRRVG